MKGWLIIIVGGFLAYCSYKLENGIPLYIPHADAASCTIYQTYYAGMEEKDSAFFRPVSSGADRALARAAGAMEREFGRDTGKVEIKTYKIGDEIFSYESPIYEPFSADLSIFKPKDIQKTQVKISNCFGGTDFTPNFSRQGLSYLNLRQGLKTLSTDVNASIHRVSPVLFSADAQRALLYGDYYCGGLCSWGGFYLYEMTPEGWQLQGISTLWVS